MFDVFRRVLSVKRYGVGSYNSLGEWIDGEESEFQIKASVQATDAEVLNTLPEGYRTTESYTIFTDTKLLTSEANKRNADVVTIEGDKFQVIKITPWLNLDYPTKHYETVLMRVNVDDAE